MRGDSLRDFYAKTLAVLGLGLLAAAGAIVDYWPVSGALPTVSGVTALHTTRAMPAPVLASELPAPVVIRASHQVPSNTRNAPRVFTPSFRSVQFTEAVVQVDAVPPVPEFDLTRVDAVWSTSTAIEIDLEAPPASLLAMGGSPQARPILTGAVSALKKTRASIREAFRSVAGTFRKVSPFFDSTTTIPSFR